MLTFSSYAEVTRIKYIPLLERDLLDLSLWLLVQQRSQVHVTQLLIQMLKLGVGVDVAVPGTEVEARCWCLCCSS
jgi:hypothetical protein